ncbi:alpha/beta fold hydrolase [Streptomyces cheonanensis]|uniref:Alpha/beta fold hydrolase n=1 Tax=Streptomyces cheonanensis TaxID=312720 RepID=A0ABP5GUA8_9ACTN|nr:alpha/beta fold hydrolase [Streptomyces harbinensis]QKV71478.1 thioesterase [Streptomyces harbinensis]
MPPMNRDTELWLRRPFSRPEASVLLVCFPHAGGAASSFRPWQVLLPTGIDAVTVQYPGRQDRFAEDPVDSMDVMVQRIADALAGALEGPYALFGHSMGSAIAYEVALELRRRELPPPVRLLASGRPAPRHATGGEVHRRGDEALAAELVRLGGTPPEVLADPELRATVLRCVRGDYRLIERYQPAPHPPLDCPVSVLTGDRDPECDTSAARTWAGVTRAPLDVTVFDGDHFFLVPQRERVAAVIARDLGLPATRPARIWPSTP